MAQLKLSKAYSIYGASMGRRDYHADDTSLPIKFSLTRVNLDSGGYDNGGAYWGTGTPLYRASNEACTSDSYVEWYFRASDRDAAKQAVIARYPNARFHR